MQLSTIVLALPKLVFQGDEIDLVDFLAFVLRRKGFGRRTAAMRPPSFIGLRGENVFPPPTTRVVLGEQERTCPEQAAR